MPSRRLAAALAAALLAAGSACGCGGSGGGRLSKAQYEQRVQTDGKALTRAIAAVGSNTASFSRLKAAVTSAEKGVRAAADDLESLTPPAEAATANTAFVTALRAIAVQLRALERAADKRDLPGVVAIVQKLAASKEIAAARTAAADLKRQGYRLGALGN